MQQLPAVLLGILLALSVVPQAISAQPAQPALPEPLRVPDPTGDAYEWGHTMIQAQAGKWCPEGVTCDELQADNGPTAAWQGVPADPALDLVGFSLQEYPDSLLVTLSVASLEPDLSAMLDEESAHGITIGVAWDTQPDVELRSCMEAVYLRLDPSGGGYAAESGHVWIHQACGNEQAPWQGYCSSDRTGCVQQVPMTVAPGTPGSISWSLPRDQMVNGSQGAALHNLHALVLRLGPHPDVFVEGAGGPSSMNQPGARLDADTEYIVDSSEPVGPHRLALPAAQSVHASGHIAWSAHHAVREQQQVHPELRLRSGEFEETPTHLILTAHLDELARDAKYHRGEAGFALPTGELYRAGLLVRDGTYTPYFGHAWFDSDEQWHWQSLPIDADVEPGSPGKVVWRVDRQDLPHIEAGTTMRAAGMLWNAAIDENPAVGPLASSRVYVRATPMNNLDWMPPYRFLYDTHFEPTRNDTGFKDPIDDLTLPAASEVDPNLRTGPYDLIGVRARMKSTDEVRFSIDVRDLSEVRVPTGYDAVFFAVGLQASKGGEYMMGFHKEVGKTGEFFCAPDTTVLAPTPADPLSTPARELIRGNVLLSGAGGAEAGGGSGSGGTIHLDVPLSCLELEATDVLSLEGVAAGVYWIRSTRDPTGRPLGDSEVDVIDLAAPGDEELPLMLLAPPEPPVQSTWARPFGFENFWDIFGVAIAVTLAAISTVIIVRKRLRMKRYLVELEDLAEHYHSEPDAYGLSLVALRKRLFQDLLSNRLTEGHFVMVEERLRSALSSTRINAFGRAFYDLPPALMIRLQSLLADGRFTPQDHQVLADLVDGLTIPSASRTEVMDRIGLWAEQDAQMAKMAGLRRRRRRRRVRHLVERPAAQAE